MMNTMPEISVIVPVYRVENYLERCLNSLLAQTFTDFEVICVNDGSPDSCNQILENYQKKDSRIRVLTQENAGLSSARNTGLAAAKGKFIYFLDSDDAVHPQLLEICHGIADMTGSDLVSFNYTKIGEIGMPDLPVYEPSKIRCKVTKKPLFLRKKRGKWRISVNVWTKFYRADLIRDMRFIPGILFEDYPFTYQVLAQHPKTAVIREPLYFYTQNQNSISHKPVSQRTITSYHRGLLGVVDSFEKAIGRERKFVRKTIFPTVLKHQWHLIQQCTDNELKQELRRLFALELCDLKARGWLKWMDNRLDRYMAYHWLMRRYSRKIVRIMGGVGNQMFQYAFGNSLMGNVLFDTSFFKKESVPKRVFELNQWRIPAEKMVCITLPKSKKIRALMRFLTLLPRVRKEKTENVWDERLLQYKTGYFDGYFQTEQYFQSNRDWLLKAFVPKDESSPVCQAIINQIRSVNAVSLHVRRGDYLKLQNTLGLGSLEYYRRAVTYIADHAPDPYFFIFSDDLDWCRQNLDIPYPCIYVDKAWDSDIWDIYLMRLCRHNIIANSSFSWWGAWLNENPNKIVIAPKTWTKDNRPTDILPDDWVKLDYF